MPSAARPPAGRPGQRLTYLVKRLELAERARLEEVLRPLGVTLAQYTVLSILERREGLSSAQLARRHFVTAQAMQPLVTAMERDGLVERRARPDNRRVLTSWLTPAGEQVLAACHRSVDVVERRMLAGLDAAEAAAFRRALEHCIDALAAPGTEPG